MYLADFDMGADASHKEFCSASLASFQDAIDHVARLLTGPAQDRYARTHILL